MILKLIEGSCRNSLWVYLLQCTEILAKEQMRSCHCTIITNVVIVSIKPLALKMESSIVSNFCPRYPLRAPKGTNGKAS